MNVSLTEEEALVRQTAQRVADLIGPATTDSANRDDAKGWAALAQAGLLGLSMIDAESPVGTGLASALVAESLATRPCAVPFVGSGVLAPALLVAAGAESSVLKRIESGSWRVAIGLSPDLAGAVTGDEGDVVVWDAASASTVVTLAEDRSVRAFDVPLGAGRPSVDLTRDVFALPRCRDGGRASFGGPIPDAAWTRWNALALATLSADLCGLMRGALDLAVAYAKSRVQFGVPIGSFQAVKHLCADALVHLETSRSAMLYAAWSVDHAAPDEALRAARVAKSFTSEAAMSVTETCIQVHGGVGNTWENLSHVFLRRALLDRQTLGDESVQLSLLSLAGRS